MPRLHPHAAARLMSALQVKWGIVTIAASLDPAWAVPAVTPSLTDRGDKSTDALEIPAPKPKCVLFTLGIGAQLSRRTSHAPRRRGAGWA